ncbi:hypothetical protein B0H13DRAFT_2377876 [Mycena leptocephala]|nr:hypothetical protein B0H13DRAFT_2377876 [Mycena leptocephala]
MDPPTRKPPHSVRCPPASAPAPPVPPETYPRSQSYPRSYSDPRSQSQSHPRSQSQPHPRSQSQPYPRSAVAALPALVARRRSQGPLTTPETTPEPSTAEHDLKSIKRPSNANISHNEEYVRFRNRLNRLAAVHLDSSAALSHQDEESLTIVNDKLVKDFPWLARCAKTWPVAVYSEGNLNA